MIDPKTLSDLPDDALDRVEFRDTLIPISWLLEKRLGSGRRGGIAGVRFIGCIIRGPGILLPAADTAFDDCNMGDVHGDVRNLFLLPAGPLIIGGISVQGCRFERCEFAGVGFAGSEAFVTQFVTSLAGKVSRRP